MHMLVQCLFLMLWQMRILPVRSLHRTKSPERMWTGSTGKHRASPPVKTPTHSPLRRAGSIHTKITIKWKVTNSDLFCSISCINICFYKSLHKKDASWNVRITLHIGRAAALNSLNTLYVGTWTGFTWALLQSKYQCCCFFSSTTDAERDLTDCQPVLTQYLNHFFLLWHCAHNMAWIFSTDAERDMQVW